MYRYIILLCAVAMQMCLGATYSWSVYVTPLKQLTGLGQGAVQTPFTIFYFMFPATMMVVGSFIHRWGVRRCALFGGLIFGSGWILAGFGQQHFILTVLGIGLLAGIGVGFAYMVPIATAVLWFPNHKGLVTGIAVAGFGGGAALASQVGGHLTEQFEFTPFQVFTRLGVAFFITVSLAGAFMKTPPHFSAGNTRSVQGAAIFKNRSFILLYLSMFAALAAGFTVNANLKELNVAISVETGILAVSLFAVANALGRILWGLLCDKTAALTVIRLNLVSQALLLIAGYWMLDRVGGFLVFAFVAGFNYGGVLVVYASTVAGKWGAENVGQVYSWLFSANIPAAVAPLLAGLVFDATESFMVFLLSLAGLLLVVAFYIGKPLKEDLCNVTKEVSQ